MIYRRVILLSFDDKSGRVLIPQARWCDGFASKLRGFTFRRQLAEGEGLVLVEAQDSRLNTAIHMLFVFFPLGVLWVNNAGRVVDKTLARPWRLAYRPQEPARYVIEGHPTLLDYVNIGDHIHFAKN
jgi:uncharacterized membrane protein (UPF0127 family)